ncbi:MAG: TetR/AcrR family transcriptional regulator [Candidatus Devosia euplotis]|nr:TetR/AcrR family transcriptional regulator [Candidatus Devosia euplotis]
MPENAKKFRRRAEARPDEVLDAALVVFVEKGFAAAKVEEVARQAGVSKGLVYLYFPSKEALLEGIVRRALAPIADHAMGDLAHFDGDPRTVITILLTMLCRQLADPGRLAVPKLIVSEVIRFPSVAAMYRREVLDKARPALERLLAHGVASGQLRPIDPEMAIRSVIGPLLAHVALSELFDVRPDDWLAMDRFLRSHLDILLYGISEVRP